MGGRSEHIATQIEGDRLAGCAPRRFALSPPLARVVASRMVDGLGRYLTDVQRMSFVNRIPFLLLSALVAVAMLVASGAVAAEQARFVRIGTGPVGGTYFPVGGAIATMISEPPGAAPCGQGGTCGVPGLIAAAVSTQGSPDNLRKMTSGALELALCQADVARDALKGEGAFARQPIPSLRAIGNLFPEAVHIIVRVGAIRTVNDLRGRRVSVGEANSGTLAAARLVLQAYGMRIREIEPVYERLARSVDMLIAGDIDALFMVGGAPIAAVALAAETIPIALLPIADRQAERMIGAQPQFFRSNIDRGAYHGVPATSTVAVRAQFLALASMPDDLVFAITRALWDERNRKLLDAIPIGIQIRRDEATENLSVPLHPGARRYYLESKQATPGER